MSTTICPNCNGKVNKDGIAGYYVYNAYDKDKERWITCECCGGTGIKNPSQSSIDLASLNILLMGANDEN